jgi:drug/metabolite transporter (DMT)-like permease
MNLISLLVLPAVIVLRESPTRYVIAGVSLVVLLVAINWSRRSGALDAWADEPAKEAA